MTRALFINQNGRIVCEKHGGSYLQSVLRNNSRAQEAETPLDHWIRIPSGPAPAVHCEDC